MTTLRTVRIGYIPLIDAAPLVVAARLGLDARQGLRFELHRQASWAAVRDRLISGELEASHALASMVLGIEMGIGGPRQDMSTLLTLNQNGQAIVLAPRVAAAWQQGVPLATAFEVLGRRPVLAQTFPTGTHALWLYHWLASQGVDPMTRVQCVSQPPPSMPDSLARGELDGFCAGEPWPSRAVQDGAGTSVVRSGDIWPGHSEKVLACRRAWAALQPELAQAVTVAVLEACRWLDAPGHRSLAAAWLAEPDVIGLDLGTIDRCLKPSATPALQAGDLTFHDAGRANVPWRSDGRWFLRQFERWGWLGPDQVAAGEAVLGDVYREDTYRAAAAVLGIQVPPLFERPMPE